MPVPYLKGAIEVAKEIDIRFMARFLLLEPLKIKSKVLYVDSKKTP